MRRLTAMAVGGALLAAAALALAQGPGQGPGPGPGGFGQGGPGRSDDFLARMMAFDRNQDGSLTRDEVSDPRLGRLFDRADADKNGAVTRQELTALAAQEPANGPGGGPGGPGGFGPPGGGMMGPPPRPGEVLPPMLRRELRLTTKQSKQIAELQKYVDDRLAKILTAEQKKRLQTMRQRPPGPPGGFRRGPGGPGGGPGGDQGGGGGFGPPGGGFGGPGGGQGGFGPPGGGPGGGGFGPPPDGF